MEKRIINTTTGEIMENVEDILFALIEGENVIIETKYQDQIFFDGEEAQEVLKRLAKN